MIYSAVQREVEAMRLTEGSIAEVRDWCEWDVWVDEASCKVVGLWDGATKFGHMGYWIVKTESGKFWPFPDKAFEDLYERGVGESSVQRTVWIEC